MDVQGPVSAKAVGEPPLLLSASVLFALEDAARAAAAQTFQQPLPPHARLAVPATVQAVKSAAGLKPLSGVLSALARMPPANGHV
jgi:xanthine dehydrogenase molybdopterin-binding subunit B